MSRRAPDVPMLIYALADMEMVVCDLRDWARVARLACAGLTLAKEREAVSTLADRIERDADDLKTAWDFAMEMAGYQTEAAPCT